MSHARHALLAEVVCELRRCHEKLSLLSDEPSQQEEMMRQHLDFGRRADMYYVYHSIQRYTDEPFTAHMPESLFNMARYLVHMMMQGVPKGISKV